MSEIHERLVAAFDYLRVKGVIHTQAEFAEAINKSPQQVSDAFKDRPKRCTLGLMNAIAGAYGIPCIEVAHRCELLPAIETMLATKGPVLLNVDIDPTDMVFPMTPAGADVDHIMLNPDKLFQL